MLPYSGPLDVLTPEERCTRCELLEPEPVGAGTLYLGLPVAYVQRKAVKLLQGAGHRYRVETTHIAVDLEADAFTSFCDVLEATFTAVERNAARALFVPAGRLPAIADFLSADSLNRVIARARTGALIATLETYLTCAFQPIFDATSLAVFGHEGLLRTLPGAPLSSPGEILRTARDADCLPQADLAARRTVITRAAATGLQSNLFINFVPSAIYDPATCLRTTIAAVDGLGLAHDRIVFEVVESEEVEDPQYLLEILRTYRQAGFRVALDDLGAGFSSLNLLHMLRPDFVKLDIALVHDIDHDPFKATVASKIIEAARALEMTVIAEGIETAGELAWLRGSGAHLLQGFYLGRPAAEPVSAVAAPS